MRFVKTKSGTVSNKYGINYDSNLETLTFMWGEHRFFIFF
jgi:hypothetical protein